MENPKLNVLLVDDDVALLAVMEESLETAGDLRIYGTNKALQAIELLGRNPFDVVISDFSLGDPIVDGLEVLRNARSMHPACLAIIITAYASLEISLEAIRLGVYDFLAKPFQIDELKLTVRNAADQIRLRRENGDLRLRIGDLAETLESLRSGQHALLEQITSIKERFLHASIVGAGAGAGMRAEALQQIHAYERSGETMGEQIEREGRRLETLLKQGLIDEPIYRKWMETRKGLPAR